jgi:uncharacterized Rossmann fold enzyme
MQPVNSELVAIQDEIRAAFNWELSDDIDSALELSKIDNPKPTIELNGHVVVIGANAPANYVPVHPAIVADGAIGAVSDFSNVKLLVSDGDGFPYIEKAIDANIPLCLHAHGDNHEQWRKVLNKTGPNYPILLTHQTPIEIQNMSNPGGFTDGDRAVCIAYALGATSVELVGFSTQEVGPWSGVTDTKRKLMKLVWMNKVIQILGFGDLGEE